MKKKKKEKLKNFEDEFFFNSNKYTNSYEKSKKKTLHTRKNIVIKNLIVKKRIKNQK
jgi:hypothetical protein